MKLTNKIIEQGRSSRGGWSLKQFRRFGVKKFKKGWKRKIIGRDFPLEVIERFLSLKDVHLAQRLLQEPEGLDAEFMEATKGI